MVPDYKSYISNNDYISFGKEIFKSSSQQLTNWISLFRSFDGIKESEIEIFSSLR